MTKQFYSFTHHDSPYVVAKYAGLFILFTTCLLTLFQAAPVQAAPIEPVTVLADPIDTTVTIVSDDPDPSMVGQEYTVTFKVQPAETISGQSPYGTVTVTEIGGSSCSRTVIDGGYPYGWEWSCNLTATSSGTKVILVTFTPLEPALYNSDTATVNHSVREPIDTSITITSITPEPSMTGEPYTVVFEVRPDEIVTNYSAYGTVTVTDIGGSSCSRTLTDGGYPYGWEWSCNLTPTSTGLKIVYAAFTPADSNLYNSSNVTENHTVEGTFVTILNDDPDPTTAGEAYEVRFRVVPDPVVPGHTPYGTVSVDDGTGATCTRSLSTGDFVIGFEWGCNLTSTTAGIKHITVSFTPDDSATYGGTSSATTFHSVTRASTTTSVVSSANPSTYGDSVTFTATVSPIPDGGTVAFKSDGSNIVGCGAQSINAGGVATCSTTWLSAGTHAITTVFSGNDNYLSSTGTLASDQQVNCASSVSVTSNADSGEGSLRRAITNVCSNATINFDDDYTIALNSQLTISQSLIIDGSGHVIILNGGSTYRVLSIDHGYTVVLDTLTVTNGFSLSDSGGGIFNHGNLTITNSTIKDNYALAGGGIYNLNSSLTVYNSTFSNNVSTNAGAILNDGGVLTLNNCTFSGNAPAAIYNNWRMNYTNTIIANSISEDCVNFGSISTNANNLVEDGSCSADLTGDPLLGTLADYGGVTQTIPLLPGSPAINAGSSCTTADQRGEARVSTCDIGAFESQGFTLTRSGGNSQTTNINTTFTNPLSVTVTSNDPSEPVNGGKVTFTPPSSGSSASITGSLAAISSGNASVTATANSIGGTYLVTASAAGAANLNFTLTNEPPPTVTTNAASNITGSTATLNGTVNANGNSTTVTFEYGLTTFYGSTVTAVQSPVTGTSDTAVSYNLPGLVPNTTYHYRVVGVNSVGTSNGSDRTFTTSAVVPTVTTNAASSITGTGATLNGTVNANNTSATVTFEYGLTDSYGLTVTADQSPVTGGTSAAVSFGVTGLVPNTTYHYRVVGANIAGTSNGADRTFTTSAIISTVTTNAASSITDTSAILNGTVNANNTSATVSFEYGLTLSYGATVTADQSPVTGSTNTAVSFDLAGLTPNATYYYRVVGENAAGTTNGSDQTFTTNAFVSILATNAASNVKAASVTLNGTANANNASTTVTFEYGLTATYGSTVTATQSPVNGTTDTAISFNLTGLASDTTYHYRVVGTNIAGITLGDDQTFTTDTSLDVTVNQAAAQPDPTNISTILFTVVFSKPVEPTTFTTDDIIITGTDTSSLTITINELAPNDATTFEITVGGLRSSCTLSMQINSSSVEDLNTNSNTVSTSTDNQVTYDVESPSVNKINLKKTITVNSSPKKIVIQFSEAVYDPDESSDPNDVTNPDNYLLIEKGTNEVTDTLSCAQGVKDDDIPIEILKVSYNNSTFEAKIELDHSLSIGYYSLFVCGTTTIVDLTGNPFHEGKDYIYEFKVTQAPEALPETGFAPGVVADLPEQPADSGYSTSSLILEIPVLGVEMNIVGIPQDGGSWDVTWLGDDAGYLYGSAFPTWPGNTVLTGHVWDANDHPTPFTHINTLKYGDQVMIHAYGMTYTYEVRENMLALPSDLSTVFQPEEYDWVTLVTCEFFNPISENFVFRRVVRAILINVE